MPNCLPKDVPCTRGVYYCKWLLLADVTVSMRTVPTAASVNLALVCVQALNRDVAEVNEMLPEQDRLELLDMVQSNSSRQNKREL